jgi:hypothetical protein
MLGSFENRKEFVMKTLLRTAVIASVAVGLLIAAPLAMAKVEKAKDKLATKETPAAKVEKKSEAEQVTYLGVGVEALHPAFWAHLRDVLEQKQGILVTLVTQDSPAEMAGIMQHDILVSYGDQKLYSPEQFVKLVQADKAGHEVKLGIVRNGKPQEVSVTLGERAVSAARPIGPRGLLRNHPRLHASTNAPVASNDRWNSFDSMTLKSLGEGRYKIEIRYEAKDGKMEHRTFEGTRQEIRQDIQAQKDLPANERGHLLRSLDMPGGQFRFDFPGVYYTPDGQVIWGFRDLDSAFWPAQPDEF